MSAAATTTHTPERVALLEELLRQTGLSRSDIEEAALEKAWALPPPSGTTTTTEEEERERLMRVVRLALTNRELRKQGLPGLLLLCPPPPRPPPDHHHHNNNNKNDDNNNNKDKAPPPPSSSPKEEAECLAAARNRWTAVQMGCSEEESAAVQATGMPADLYATIRGTHGRVMGLCLNKVAFTQAMRASKGKRAKRLSDNPDRSRAYMAEQLVRIARRTATYITRTSNNNADAYNNNL
jgi:hypothetical protein